MAYISPTHPLPAFPSPLPIKPGLLPPQSVEGSVEVLPVSLPHQGEALFRDSPRPVIQALRACFQQGTPAGNGQTLLIGCRPKSARLGPFVP